MVGERGGLEVVWRGWEVRMGWIAEGLISAGRPKMQTFPTPSGLHSLQVIDHSDLNGGGS